MESGHKIYQDVFEKYVLAGMLEAFDFENIDQMSIFLQPIPGVFFGDECTAKITTACTMYSERLLKLKKKQYLPFWTGSNLDKLE